MVTANFHHTLSDVGFLCGHFFGLTSASIGDTAVQFKWLRRSKRELADTTQAVPSIRK